MKNLVMPMKDRNLNPARWLQRARIRRELLQKNERLLADMGMSRELLLEGVKAWPWNESQHNVDGTPDHIVRHHRLFPKAAAEIFRKAETGLLRTINVVLSFVLGRPSMRLPSNHPSQVALDKRNSDARAIAELSAYTDAELKDLGIARASIKTLVRYGRPGYPEYNYEA